MNYFYPATSQPAGKAVSEIMWQLCLPASERQGGVTNRAFGVIVGANNQTYVCMSDTFQGVLHPDADSAQMVAMLQPFENAGHLPAGTVADLVAWINATRALPTPAERTFTLWDKFPDYFKGLSLTELPSEASPASPLLAPPR